MAYALLYGVLETHQHRLATADPGRLPKGQADPGRYTEPVYCAVCDSYNPPRSKHLRRDNACYATFDHDCALAGNAIAEKNRYTFLLYVVAQALYNLGFLVCRTLMSARRREPFAEYYQAHVALFVLGTLSAGALVFAGAVSALHIFLAYGLLTQHELGKLLAGRPVYNTEALGPTPWPANLALARALERRPGFFDWAPGSYAPYRASGGACARCECC